MEVTRKLLKKEEVLRYLGYQGTELPVHTERLIESCMLETLNLVRPSYLYRNYPIRETKAGIQVEGTTLCLTGKDIRTHLKNCQEVYLICATIGTFVDKNIRLKMVMEPAAGVVLDSCGSVAVEQVMEAAEQEIEREVRENGNYITWRFSPGYGDLPLSLQQELTEVLDTYRKLGVSVSEDMLLAPSKSVTAIIGVLNPPTDKETLSDLFETVKTEGKRKCDVCKNRERCNFYQKGKTC